MIPKKKFGQNFLMTPHYVDKIINAIPAQSTESVLEIGPGRGALSVPLCRKYTQLRLVEKDRELIPLLTDTLPSLKSEYIINDDFLHYDLTDIPFPLHVVGNLPYNIAAMIIKKVLFHTPPVSSITFMVQKEVAQRIVATPESKNIGFLTLFCHFFGNPKLLFHIPPGAFFPKPKVESSVFQLITHSQFSSQLYQNQWNNFFNFISRSFLMRRKTLLNNLLTHIKKRSEIETLLNHLKLEIHVRPEQLSIQSWIDLYINGLEHNLWSY